MKFKMCFEKKVPDQTAATIAMHQAAVQIRENV